MSSPELAELEGIRALIASGRQLGALTYGEVAAAVAGLDLDETDIEELHNFLEGCEIELVNDRAAAGRSGGSPRPGPGREAHDAARPHAGHDDRLPSALPQGHRQGPAADAAAGARIGEADRARGMRRQAEDGRVQPAARRLLREELSQPRAALPRPHPGGHDRADAGGGEVRLPQGVQILDL